MIEAITSATRRTCGPRVHQCSKNFMLRPSAARRSRTVPRYHWTSQPGTSGAFAPLRCDGAATQRVGRCGSRHSHRLGAGHAAQRRPQWHRAGECAERAQQHRRRPQPVPAAVRLCRGLAAIALRTQRPAIPGHPLRAVLAALRPGLCVLRPTPNRAAVAAGWHRAGHRPGELAARHVGSKRLFDGPFFRHDLLPRGRRAGAQPSRDLAASARGGGHRESRDGRVHARAGARDLPAPEHSSKGDGCGGDRLGRSGDRVLWDPPALRLASAHRGLLLGTANVPPQPRDAGPDGILPGRHQHPAPARRCCPETR